MRPLSRFASGLAFMKPVQLVLIAVALVASLGAGYLVMNMSEPPAQVVVQTDNGPAIPTIPTRLVLVAVADVPQGTTLSENNMRFEEWPETGVRPSFVTQKDAPEAIKDFSGAIARSSFFAGEPIRDAKIVRSDSGYLSAILPAGKRAVAIEITASSSAGGFILPNDHVDVIMARQQDGEQNVIITDTILQNIRVLALDQLIEEEEGKKSTVGETVTLELTAEQVEIVAAAQQINRRGLTLALRSVEDAEIEGTSAGRKLLSSGDRKSRGTVRIIRYGKAKEVEPSK
ncbi:Flp pilus assembly protein CpaB [Ahrensia sp. R2A130]|nr:Flp pilus assembly protein CpaB [Ahrensia sp. R2A130]